MKKRQVKIAMIVGPVLILMAATVALGFGSGTVWQLIGSGGGTVQGSGRQLTSSIGQPLAGKVSDAYTLVSGFYMGTLPTRPTNNVIYIPIVNKNLSDGFQGPSETEPNDAPTQTNGPLGIGFDIKGGADDHGTVLDNDWFY